MKRYLALLLAAVTTLSVAACGPANSGDEDDTKPYDDSYYSEISTKTFGGASYDWISNSGDNFPVTVEDGEDYEPTVVDQAIAERFEIVGKQYDVKFNYIVSGGSGASVSAIEQDVMSDGKSYDVANGSYVYLGGPLVHKGLSLPVSYFEQIDLDKEWWPAKCQTDLAIGGNIYYLTGPIVKDYYVDTGAMFFNKDLLNKFNVEEDIYQLVKDGKWTFDKMTEIASVVGSEEDTGYWQFAVDDLVGFDLYFSAGLKITNYDEDGYPYLLDQPSERMISVIDKYSSFFSQADKVYNHTLLTYDETMEYEMSESLFGKGLVMFFGHTTGSAISLRSTDVNFGIVPTPVYNEGDEYIGYTSVWNAGAFCFPRTQADAEMTAVVTEALAYASYYKLKPALYDNMLMSRSVLDSESSPMLDIVFRNKAFDMCDCMEWGNLNYLVRDCILGVKDTFVSEYKSTVEAAKTAMAETVKYYQTVVE